MITWIVMFIAAVAVAFVAAYLLLRPSSIAVEQQENVVEFPPKRRRENSAESFALREKANRSPRAMRYNALASDY